MIKLTGRIDSNNAAQFEREIMDAAAQAPDAELILDASDLEYISSAGLRVLMKLRKQAKKALPVLNVSPEVYEIGDSLKMCWWHTFLCESRQQTARNITKTGYT